MENLSALLKKIVRVFETALLELVGEMVSELVVELE